MKMFWQHCNLARVTMGHDQLYSGQIPWQALLWTDLKDIKTGKKIGGFCGGTIISPYHILTAAHCIKVKDGGAPLRFLRSPRRSPFRLFGARSTATGRGIRIIWTMSTLLEYLSKRVFPYGSVCFIVKTFSKKPKSGEKSTLANF